MFHSPKKFEKSFFQSVSRFPFSVSKNPLTVSPSYNKYIKVNQSKSIKIQLLILRRAHMQNRLYFVRLHPFRLCCRSAVHPSRLARSDRDIIAISRLQSFPLASAASLPAFRRSVILASSASLPGLYIS